MKYTNSAFRTRAERECLKGLSHDELHKRLVAVGVPTEDATEFLDDPSAIPTSVRKLLVARFGT